MSSQSTRFVKGAVLIAVLGMTAIVGVGEAQAVTQPSAPPSSSAAALPTTGLNYVAIGDSYSSGIGVLPVNPDAPAGCGQSLDNFPHQVATALDLNLTDVTCSGAQAENITTVGQQVGTVTLPVQTAALSASTDVVTITVGGNNLKFTAIAAACAAASPAGPLLYTPTLASCQQIPMVAALPTAIPQLVGIPLAQTYAAVRAAAPNAKIFVLGYPSIAPDAVNLPASCFSPISTPNSFPFTDADTPFLHTIEAALNNTVQSAAATAGFSYIPTFENSLAHSSCAAPATSYVNGVYVDFTDPANPVILEKSLHPNAAGVSFMADSLEPAIAAAFPATTAPPTTPPTTSPTATPTPSQSAADPTATAVAVGTSTAAASAGLAATGQQVQVMVGIGAVALVLMGAGVSALLVQRRRHRRG